MSFDNPEFSVIIPAYNAEETIERSIASALKQKVPLEVIVVDDNSIDNTSYLVERCRQYTNANIKLYKSNVQLGVSGARNLAVKHASAPYLAFLDADDIWLEEKLSTQLKHFVSNPAVVLSTCDSLKVDPRGAVLSRSHCKQLPVSGNDAWKTLLSYNFIPTPTVVIPTELFKRLSGFNEQLIVGEDLDLWIRVAKLGDVAFTSKVLVHYFDYPGSLMKRGVDGVMSPVMDMLSEHLKDNRLEEHEITAIKARRYYEQALHCFDDGRHEEQRLFFSLAVQFGFNRKKIYELLIKHRTKKIVQSMNIFNFK